MPPPHGWMMIIFATDTPPVTVHDWPALLYVAGLIFLAWQAQRAKTSTDAAATAAALRDKLKAEKLEMVAEEVAEVKRVAAEAAALVVVEAARVKAAADLVKDAAELVAERVAEVKDTLARTNGH